MDYRKYGDCYYVRFDKGDEVISGLMKICQDEGIPSATFSGIGGCSEAEIQTYIPEDNAFETEHLTGMLELVSLTGNILKGAEGRYHHHTHAVFSYKSGSEHHVSAGHIRSTRVLYTAEIELRPVIGGEIRLKKDPETGTRFWDFI